MLRRALLPVLLVATAASLSAQEAPRGRFTMRGSVLELSADGRYSVTARGRLIVGGTLQARGDIVELRDDAGPGLCQAGAGRYRFGFEADSLRLEVIEDPCDGRRSALTSGRWARIQDALALVHATLIDGSGAPPRPGMTILMRDARIAAVFADGAEALPPDVRVRDASGLFVLPGLVDAHVHMATDPSTTDRRDRVERRLRAALRGGVVAVRDMAGDARALADLSRAAAVGDIVSPEIHYSALMAGPEFFEDPRVRASTAGVPVGTAPWARAVTDTTDLRQAVAEARGTGATGIKLYAALDAARTATIVAEAHRQHLPVWAHLVLAPALPGDVVAAGVDVVSHAAFVAWAPAAPMTYTRRSQIDLSIGPDHPAVVRLFRDMQGRGTIFDVTLFVYRPDSTLPDTAFAVRRFARAVDYVRAAKAAGVRIAAGTDGLISEADSTAMPNIHAELLLLVDRAGFTPMEALVAATRTSAEAGGFADHGTVQVGKAADLLVLRADPTADIHNTRAIGFVVRRGVILEQPTSGSAPPRSP